VKKYSLWQKTLIKLFGHVYVGHRTYPGWKGSMPFYAFKCPKHGIVEDYPRGFDEKLRCPKCNLIIIKGSPIASDNY